MARLTSQSIPTTSLLRHQLLIRTRAEIASAGWSRHDIDRALEDGVLVPCGAGRYAVAETDPRIIRALSLNARLTCISACELHGLWTPPHAFILSDPTALRPPLPDVSAPGWDPLHVAYVRRHPALSSSPALVTAHRRLKVWPDDEPVLPLTHALIHALRCLPPLSATVLLESALHLHKLSLSEVEDALAKVNRETRRRVGQVSPLSESGTETVVAHFFRHRRVAVRQQVSIDGVGRVDLVVGDWLVIECDSFEFHAQGKHYHRDRARDAGLLSRGYHVVRLTWEDVMLRWSETRARLSWLVEKGLHRRRAF